jgi:hypothetical protein
MRVFWIILTLVIAGSGAVVFMPNAETSSHPAEPTSAQTNASPTESVESKIPVDASIPNAVETPAPVENETDNSEFTTDSMTESSDNTAELSTTTDSTNSLGEAMQDELEEVKTDPSEITADSIIANLDSMLDAIEELPDEESATDELANDSSTNGWEKLAANSNESEDAEVVEETPAATETAEIPDALTIARNDDGSMTIGGTFNIIGKGTQDNPYILPWEYMVSLREYYNPREGKKAIPSHIAMFDGSYISIAGYLQFPLATPEPVECLVMLNQWDGCCIGVPPTPYDAIEVSLAEPASREQKFAVEGRIVGKLKIDPYLVGNWLIGLYLLTDASVDVSGTRTAEEVYGNTPSQLIPGSE